MSLHSPPSIYERSLITRGHGFPLWFPEPDLKRGEIQVGDVGLKFPGEFIRIFNTMKPEGDPVNKFGVPSNMSTLKVLDHQWSEKSNLMDPSPICSKATSVRSAHADASM